MMFQRPFCSAAWIMSVSAGVLVPLLLTAVGCGAPPAVLLLLPGLVCHPHSYSIQVGSIQSWPGFCWSQGVVRPRKPLQNSKPSFNTPCASPCMHTCGIWPFTFSLHAITTHIMHVCMHPSLLPCTSHPASAAPGHCK